MPPTRDPSAVAERFRAAMAAALAWHTRAGSKLAGAARERETAARERAAQAREHAAADRVAGNQQHAQMHEREARHHDRAAAMQADIAREWEAPAEAGESQTGAARPSRSAS